MTPAVHHNSSDSTLIATADLSTVQAQVVAALAQGKTISAAARQAGIHRTSIHNWFRDQPEFKSDVHAAREYNLILNDQLRELASTNHMPPKTVIDRL